MTASTGVPLRVLHIEDYEEDSLLLQRYLTRAGYLVTLERVETADALEEALARGTWDVAVTDHVLPALSAAAARLIIRDKAPELPVILLSGAVGEEAAKLAAIQAGIRDHILKNSLSQFVEAIPLAAGVVPACRQARVHLSLGDVYVRGDEPNLARGMYHYEEALRTAQQGEDKAAALIGMAYCHVQMEQYGLAMEALKRYAAVRRQVSPAAEELEGEAHYQLGRALARLGQTGKARRAFLRAEQCFGRQGMSDKAEACRDHLLHLPEEEGRGPSEWAGCLERGRYHLMMGESRQAAAEGSQVLELAGDDPVRCFHACMLLLGCAESDGDGPRALAYAIAARVTAMEAGRLDLSYAATEALGEVVRSLGPAVKDALAEVERNWRCHHNVDLWRYIPFSLRGAPEAEPDW